ncbi:P-loop containing nucleoside triphosphate hydrolase protein [Xylariomycetidae sp. FL0641]|nr:P-loop containing nucleoside triphosphate hydrolase protein [Xylariomycetidae sp. FL0641]
MAQEKPKTILVGISGASSSGKTTLARLLRDVFPNTFILHEDDFYKPESELPKTDDGLLNWDCVEAIDVPAMERALEHIRAEGTFPPFVDSKEDQNSVGPCPVPPDSIASARARVHARLTTPPPRICILDGFLLYARPALARTLALLDPKLFLRVGAAQAVRRRGHRDGYVTLEGFWADPPGYVEKVVWPAYAEAHRWLFADGDVEGRLDGEVLRREGILARAPEKRVEEADDDMNATFQWAVDVLLTKVEEVKGQGR